MKKFPADFIFQISSLFIAILLVHAIYVAIIRPNANAVLAAQAEQINADVNYVLLSSSPRVNLLSPSPVIIHGTTVIRVKPRGWVCIDMHIYSHRP